MANYETLTIDGKEVMLVPGKRTEKISISNAELMKLTTRGKPAIPYRYAEIDYVEVMFKGKSLGQIEKTENGMFRCQRYVDRKMNGVVEFLLKKEEGA